jgi:hypothetical protein
MPRETPTWVAVLMIALTVIITVVLTLGGAGVLDLLWGP